MPTTNYLLTCGRVVKDQYSMGLLTLLDVFQKVILEKGSKSTVRSFFVTGKLIVGKVGNVIVTIKIMGPDGREFVRSDMKGNLIPGDTEVVARFELLKFEKIGKYLLKAEIDGVTIDDNDLFFFEVIHKD